MFAGPSFKLFRVLGIQVSAHWSLLIAAALFAWSMGGLTGLLSGALLFGSVLLHELGHAVVAQRRRVPIAGIDLHLFGGVAKMTAPPRSPQDEMAIAIAGPLVSLGLAVIGLGTAFALPAAPGWLWYVGGANAMLFLFNLLPALPMDGGRVLRAALASKKGLIEGTRQAVKVSRVFAVLIGVAGVVYNPWLIAMAVLVWMMGSAEQHQMRVHERLHNYGYRHADLDPWARYHAAAQKGRGPEVEIIPPGQAPRPPRPQDPASVLAAMVGGQGPRPVTRRQVVTDSFGRRFVVEQTGYQW